MRSIVIAVMAMTVLAIIGTLWFVIITMSNDINNKKLKYCTHTPMSILQDQGLYNDCLRRMR